ncbi:MAG: hypothetical protein ACK56I_00115, partial [bacterium]
GALLSHRFPRSKKPVPVHPTPRPKKPPPRPQHPLARFFPRSAPAACGGGVGVAEDGGRKTDKG